jgi:hypothetical protein
MPVECKRDGIFNHFLDLAFYPVFLQVVTAALAIRVRQQDDALVNPTL